ncbi:tetratricopeptide repeat-containing sulfotransferase family protein [Iodidimonas gelatinilytica]|nr:tetratricopeptide repeat-containing sulfotransferase family protein [Iodidimonas gelatinilytica]
MMQQDHDQKTDVQAALKQARAQMMKGAFEDALSTLGALWEDGGTTPELIDKLYMRAVCCRYLKRYDEAQAHLRALNESAPDFGRGFQEEGHLLRAMGQVDAALHAYGRACRFNPALSASWTAQAEILAAKGDLAAAKHAQAQAAYLAKLPPELLSVSHLIYEGKIRKAETLCRHFLQNNPHHIEGMRLLAEIGVRMGVLEDADFLLESALALDPDNKQVRLDYIQVLRKRQKFAAALAQAKQLYEEDPENPVFLSNYAIESLQVGDYERALALFDQVLEILPHDPATLTSRGHALKTYGRQDEAVASYRAALAAKPDHADAWYALANLKTYGFKDDDLAKMERLEQSPSMGLYERVHFCFSLGKAYEDREAYDAAFGYYERGNALKRRQSTYRTDQMLEELRAQAEICSKELFEKQGGKGCPAPDPIFIVGLPRAGSTLLEQILASHSQVDGTLELPNILALSHRLRGRKRIGKSSAYPLNLHDLSADKLKELGQTYLDDTRIHRQGAPFFTDKMPNNFRHIGLIALILPNARIIDARRHPMACCFSGFKQLFAEGQEFTYGLEEIGHYYRGYVDLMDHWDRVLPGKILRVQHEDVVEDLDGQVRRILDFCGLDFEPACVEFHKTNRSVRTASSEQVRRPISTKGLEQWRHFEPHLGALKKALGPVLERYPID